MGQKTNSGVTLAETVEGWRSLRSRSPSTTELRRRVPGPKGRHSGRSIKRLSAKSVHTELAHRHHKVMRLVVSALNHDAHKAECL